jgi:ubiquinone biosynthesis protein UbiJ
MSEGLKKLIQDAKEDINKKQADASNVIDDEIQTALKGALDVLSNNGEIKKLEQAMKFIDAKVDRLDSDFKQVI